MLLRRYQPTIRKLSNPIKPVNWVPFPEMVSGPVSPLERNPQSPKGWKNRESDGIGLGIVVALERSDGRKRPDKIKYASDPISIGTQRAELGYNWRSCSEARVDKGGKFFCGSPPPPRPAGDLRGFQMADFLNYCYLCRKRLHGKDIYMYGGEKAFCSVECRYQQIVSDEFLEKCGSEALIRASYASRSSYTDDQRLFFTSIAAS